MAQESKYLIVQGIPALGLHKDLVNEFSEFGTVEEYHLLDNYPTEQFTEVLWIKFAKIQSARFLIHYYLIIGVRSLSIKGGSINTFCIITCNGT